MVDRIKQIMDYKQMSIAAFSDKINVNRSSMTHIFNGRNQPSLDIAKKILNAFPDISTEWLIMGVGKMTQTVAIADSSPDPVTSIVDNMRQTELFADASVGSIETAAEPFAPVVEPIAVETEAVPEPEPIAAQESVVGTHQAVEAPVVPSVVPPTTRTRRSSESHNSGRDSKRERISNSQGDKKLVKIVFFYDDRSFEEYFPS